MKDTAITIATEGNKKIEIIIKNRTYPQSTDDEDRKWLDSDVSVSILGFTAVLGIKFRIEEFINFYNQVLEMINGMLFEGLLANLEENLYIRCYLSKSGNILWNGYVKDFEENTLRFSLTSDFIALVFLKDQLKRIINKYSINNNH
jgi:hypothetical protein